MVKDATLTMALILVSRLLGFVRERAVAEVFGRTAQTDAFKAAFNIPDLMYSLLVGGAITAAFLPVFAGYLARGEEEEGWHVASTFLHITFALLVLLTGAGMALAPWLSPLVAYAYSGEQRELLVELMRWMFPTVFLTGVAGLGMGILNSYRRFSIPLLGPILYNLGIILGAYVLGPRMGIRGMAAGTLAGAFVNAAVQWVQVLAFRRRWMWVLDYRHPQVRRLYRLMLPSMVGLSVTQLSLIISSNLASSLPAGSITALNLANRLMQFPLGVFAMGMSTVVFPAMAGQAALGQWGGLSRTLSRSLRGVLFVTIPSAVGLAVLAEPLVRLLFEAGAFSRQDTVATAHAVVLYAPALVAQSAIQILTRAFYSLQDTRTPVAISTAALGLHTLLNWALLRATGLGHGGLALGFSLTSWVSGALYVTLLRRRLQQLSWRELLGFCLRCLVASLPMAAGAWWAAAVARQHWGVQTLGARLGQVTAAGTVATVLYLPAAHLVGIGEASETVRLLGQLAARWRGRLARPAGRQPQATVPEKET